MPQLSLNPKETKLIAVGIASYSHYEYRAREDSRVSSSVIKSRVEGAIVASSERLAQVAQSVLLIPEKNIMRVKSAGKSLLSDISDFGAQCETLIFYFCGHGISHNSTLYLGLDDLRVENPALSSVSMNEVTEQMGKLRTKNNIVILDCCQSGAGLGALTDEKADESRIRHGMNHNGTFGISGSLASQRTVVDFDSGQAAFTKALCDVLESGLGKLKMELTLDDVYRGVRDMCADRGLPRPMRVSSIDDTDFVFCKNSRLWTDGKPVFAQTIILSKVEEFDKRLPHLEADLNDIDRKVASIQTQLIALQSDVPKRFDRLWKLGNDLAKDAENKTNDLAKIAEKNTNDRFASIHRMIAALFVVLAVWFGLILWHFRHLGGLDAWLNYLSR